MSEFTNQNYVFNQLMLPTNMNNLYQDKDQALNAYFNHTPLICNGLSLTQAGTSNVFDFTVGCVRFRDQANVISGGVVQSTYSYVPAVTGLNITVEGTGSSPQYYIVVMLTQTPIDTNNVTMTAEVIDTAMTLAQISSSANPEAYIPLRTITTSDHSVYTVGYDANCVSTNAMNYLTSRNGTLYLTEHLNVTGNIENTGNITSTHGQFKASGNSQVVETNIDGNTAFRMTSSTYNRQNILFFDPTISNFPGGIRCINPTTNDFSQIVAVPGRRAIMYTSLDGISNSGIVVQSDFNAFSGTANDSLGSPFSYNYVTLPSELGAAGMRIIQGTISGDLSTARTFTLPVTFNTFSVCFTAAGSIFPIFNASIAGNTFTARSNISATNTNYLIIGKI